MHSILFYPMLRALLWAHSSTAMQLYSDRIVPTWRWCNLTAVKLYHSGAVINVTEVKSYHSGTAVRAFGGGAVLR